MPTMARVRVIGFDQNVHALSPGTKVVSKDNAQLDSRSRRPKSPGHTSPSTAWELSSSEQEKTGVKRFMSFTPSGGTSMQSLAALSPATIRCSMASSSGTRSRRPARLLCEHSPVELPRFRAWCSCTGNPGADGPWVHGRSRTSIVTVPSTHLKNEPTPRRGFNKGAIKPSRFTNCHKAPTDPIGFNRLRHGTLGPSHGGNTGSNPIGDAKRLGHQPAAAAFAHNAPIP